MFRAPLRSPFIDLLRHSIGVAGLTLVQRAIAILRKYGTNAHIYLPGIGTISGLTAGNYLDSAGTMAASVDNPVGLVVDPLGAINATQATTANKPILRQSGGKYSWQFDGSNDFLQTAMTTGDAGWLCAGVTFTDSDSTVFCSGAGSAAQKGIWTYRVAASDTFVSLIGNGTAPTSPASISAPAGQPLVVASGWDASNIFHSVNTTENTATRTGSASPSPVNLRIGAYTDGTYYPLGGSMSAALVFNVLPTADERLTLKRFVGQLSGVSI